MYQQATLPFVEVQTQVAQEERQRLARELHDTVAQLLYGISLEAAAAVRSCRAGNTQQTTQRLVDIQEDALQALCEIRLLICDLDPPLLEEAGLAVALQACLGKVTQRSGLQTSLIIEDIDRLPPPIERELYRIAVEALSNLMRHAQAHNVEMHLCQVGKLIRLQIKDDGQGFNYQTARSNGGLGLHSMQERARRLNGRLEIESEIGRGTRIVAEVPLANGGENEHDSSPHRR